MIVFDLECRTGGHRFEGWFASSEQFASQLQRGLVCCPHCGAADVGKAVMAPSVGRKGNQVVGKSQSNAPVVGGTLPPEAQAVMTKLAELQSAALKDSRWVGKSFAAQSREIHYGEREAETIHGQATPQEAQDLHDEGIAVMPLPFPIAPPDELN